MLHSSVSEAIQTASKPSVANHDREAAIDYLGSHPTPDAIDALIDLLETDDAGLRWRSADALARMGRPALAPLLHALVDKSDSRWLLEGATHVLHDNRDHKVAKMTEGLRAAMKGSGAAVATVTVAGELLVKLAGEAA
ncbi:HEAT repeat domain-containing protein [Caldilinea sp.]|uniref:HEAT repeat domain-containing protein n=1 Tax=Caldilinea sp. TaxID=2293560 RepID=UPI002C02C424|nr:HEAT repeat domain-containing protein [Caldilinea sp.]